MKTSLLALAATVALASPLTARAADLSGAWVVKGDYGPKFRYTLLCVLKTGETTLSGPCVAAQGRVMPATGRLDGKKMQFQYLADYNGSGLQLAFNGTTQDGGEITGSVRNRLGTGVFKASPLLKPAEGDPTTTYKVSVTFPELEYVVVCDFKAKGSALRGPCAVVDGQVLNASGTVEGGKVTLGYDTVLEGKPIHVDYVGTASPDGDMKGAVKAGDSSGSFTGKLQ